MLHNSDPFGSSEAPLNMGASVNMTMNGSMNIPNGFNMGKAPHEASQSSNPHNLSSYPGYGYPVMNPHNHMHHFQNFHSNVFQSSFMGHNSPALHDTSWQHGLLPMNLNTHSDNSSNMNFYDRKEFGYGDYKDQNLPSKNVPLNVPQVYSKAYHKEAPVSHNNYSNYHDPSTRLYDKPYINNNLDLSMNKVSKPETRSYDLDLSTKPPALDESRRRSLENTVKMIENILIHNPTSSNYSMSQMKNAQIANSDKNMYNEKLESKNTYDERSGNRNMYNDRLDYKNVSNERQDNKNTFNERSDSKNMYSERTNPQSMFSERSDLKNTYNEKSDAKNMFTERSDPKTLYNDVGYNKHVFNLSSANLGVPNECLGSNNICNETSNNKTTCNDKTDTHKNIFSETKTLQATLNEDKDANVAESSKNDDNTNIKSIYSCSTENSVESEVNSDERNNNFTISSENENTDSINDEIGVNQIEKVEIKVELQSNGSESESEDVKPLATYVMKNPLEVYTEVSQSDNGIEVKVEELSSWADSEQCNPFQRDIFGVTHDCTMNGTIIDSENSLKAAKEAINEEVPEKTFYECPNCTLFFIHPKRFLIHSKWHSLQLPIEKKNEIEMEKVMKRNMRKEARKVWKMNNEEVKDGNAEGEVFKCNSCDKMFSTKGSLKNHKQRAHPTLVRECLICHKTLVGWQAIKTHRATEHTSLSDSRYQCTECPKRFKFSHSLVKHLDTHLEKTHGCELCPKMFGSQKLLSTHMKTHERLQRGITCHCSYCGKGFFETYQLQVHERTHRNERPFLCQICNTSFGTNSSLQRHLKVSHSSSKPWQCETCHRNFVSEKIRDRHVLRHHGDQENFKFLCTQCPCRYLNQKDLNKHILKNHPRPGRKKRTRKNNDSE